MLKHLTLILGAVMLLGAAKKPAGLTPKSLHDTATAFYQWRQNNYPVWSSDQGLHTWDHRLTDYSPGK